MADETPSDEPEQRSDAAEGTITAESSSPPASHLNASVDCLGQVASSSPDEGACLVHSTSKAPVRRGSDCAPFTAAADPRRFPWNTRTSSTSHQQGNPELGFTRLENGACVTSHISHPRSHNTVTNPVMIHPSHALDHTIPSSHSVSRGSTSLKPRLPLKFVPASSHFPSGAHTQETKNRSEGALPRKGGDKQSAPVKNAVETGVTFEKTDSSFGGRGEMVRPDVFTVSTKYAVIWHKSENPPNGATEDNTAAGRDNDLAETTRRDVTSGDREEREGGFEDGMRDAETPNQPDLRLIQHVVDDLIGEFESKGLNRSPSVPLSPRLTPPSPALLTRSEPLRRTHSSPIYVGEKRDGVTPPSTKRKGIAPERIWASTTLQELPSPDEASHKESSADNASGNDSWPVEESRDKRPPPDENGERGLDLGRVFTACSVLESVSKEARQLCDSLSNMKAKRKRLMNPTVDADDGRDDEADNNCEDSAKPTADKNYRVLIKKSKSSNKRKGTKKRRKSVGATTDKPRSLSKQRERGSSEKSGNTVKILLVARRKNTKASKKTRKRDEANKNDDVETSLCARHSTPRLRKRRTQLVNAHQPSCLTLRRLNYGYVPEQWPQEPILKHRRPLHRPSAPGRLFSQVKAQKRQAKNGTVGRGLSNRALNTDEYCYSNEDTRSARRTLLCRVSSSNVKSKVGLPICAHRLVQAKACNDVNVEPFLKSFKAGGRAIDVDVSSSVGSEHKWKRKKRFYCNSPRIGKGGVHREVRSFSKLSFVRQGKDGETVLMSELSSPIENRAEEGTEIEARSIPRWRKRRRYQQRKPDDDREPLLLPGIKLLHSSHSVKRVLYNRDRHLPRAEIRGSYNSVALRDFGKGVERGSRSVVESVRHSPIYATVTSHDSTSTNQRGSAPLSRNSSPSLSVDLEWRPGRSSNTGPVNVRCGRRRPTRPSSLSVEHVCFNHGYPQRDFEHPLLTPQATTPFPLPGTQPAPVVYRHRRETVVYTSILRPPFPVPSPLPQCVTRPPVCFEPTALFNEPTLAHSYPLRPPFLGQSTSSGHLQEALSTSKATQGTAAEPNFPQLAHLPPEEKYPNKELPTARSSLQAPVDATKHQESLPSQKVIVGKAPIGMPSLIPTVPSLSSFSTSVQQRDHVTVERASTRLSLPVAERSRPALFYHTNQVLPADIDLAATLQRDDDPASGTSARGSCSNSTYGSLAQERGFGSEGEMETPHADARSTNFIMSSAEKRLPRKYVKALLGRRVKVCLVIVLACLTAGISACFIIPASRRQPLGVTESEEDLSWEYLRLFRPPPNTKSGPSADLSSCYSQLCNEHAGTLFRSLDASMPPCRNFYGHVCALAAVNGTADEQLAEQTTHWALLFLKAHSNDAEGEHPLVAASRQLWKDCVQLATLGRKDKAPLLALLNLTGLGAWPYDDSVALPDVWKVAGDLQRLMELAPLVQLKGFAGGKAHLAPGNLGGSDDASDVLDSMLELHPNSSRLLELAAEVAGFNRRLKSLRYHQPVSKPLERNDTGLVPRSYLETALSGFVPDVGAVDIQCDPLVMPLVQFVGDSRPRTVLNMLGYRLVRHVDLFTAAAANIDIQSGAVLGRESRCTRAILDDALTNDEAEYVQYAAVGAHLNFSSVRSVVAEVKNALDAKLAKQRWLGIRTRARVRRHLREIKVRFFFDRYESRTETKQASQTLALPSQALATYQRFRESRFRTRLLQGAAYDDVGGDQDCAYDQHKKVLFLRLSAVELRNPQSPLWPALQAARLGPPLSRCMLALLLPTPTDRNVRAAVHWSPASHTRLDGLRACIRAQQARQSMATESASGPDPETLAVLESAALGPARDVFRAYVERLVGKDTEAQSATDAAGRSTEWDKVFYLSYAHSMCETPAHGRHLLHHTPHWKTVNKQLSNDGAFQRAFECRSGDPMRLEKTCSFWESSH